MRQSVKAGHALNTGRWRRRSMKSRLATLDKIQEEYTNRKQKSVIKGELLKLAAEVWLRTQLACTRRTFYGGETTRQRGTFERPSKPEEKDLAAIRGRNTARRRKTQQEHPS